MKNFIQNMKFGRRISSMSASALRKIIVSVLLFGNLINAQALTITPENSTVCPHEGVILRANGATTSSVIWQKYENGKWVNASDMGSQLKSDVPFIYEMDDHDVQFRVVEKEGLVVKNASDPITIKKGTDCVPDCHTSSTGDFINGTDFDKLPQYSNLEKPQVPQQIESFFDEYKVGFENLYPDYKITKDLSQTFSGQLPIKDGGQQNNSYYVPTVNVGQTHPFRYIYPCDVFHGKDYRLVMRMYVMRKNPHCSAPSASLKLETEQGEQTTDRAKIVIYEDATDKRIREDYVTEDYGLVRLNLSDASNVNKLYRVDVTFYGHFPDDKYDSRTGKYNGLTDWVLKPFFQQFDGCFTIAIDYLSAEVENVCLSPKLQCNGETVNATAFGFGDDVTYTWYEESKGGWSKVFGDYHGKGDKYRVLPIKIDFIGAKRYKVVVNKPDNKSSELSFTVYGKECNPIMPSDIIGSTLICTPDNDQVYSIDPVSEDPTVNYRWSLITPSGKVIENSTVYQGSGEGIVSDTKGASVKLYLPALSEHGKYTLQAQVVRRVTEANGSQHDDHIGEPIKKIINVHNTPNVKLTLTGNSGTGSSEKDKTLCPADITTNVVANVDVTNKSSDHKYNFTWTGATAASKTATTATVSWDRAAACDGTLTSHTISVKAEIDGIGCPATVSQTYKFEKPVAPTIDCSKIDGSEYILGATEKTKTIDLPLPVYTASCDPDPKMTIDVVVKDLKGNKLTGTDQSRTITFSMSQSSKINKKVVAPAGTVELTYSVTDGCGKTVTCDAIVSVLDKTAPDVDCSKIPSYTAHLKNQKGCVAVPGDYSKELPVLTAPNLPDLNGVDGYIKGEYMGRVEKESEPAMVPSGFKKTVGLNDPYNKGVTWILWKFSDESGNFKYCLQKVTVEDDKDPNVTCPNIDLGTLDVDTLTCTLKPSSVIAKIKEVAKLPYGFDECSSSPKDSLVPTLYYRIPKEGDDLIEIKDSQLDDPIFMTGIKYEIVWVFKKKPGAHVDANVSVECAIPFQVEDQDAPEFDCSSLINIMVYPNFRTTTTDIEYEGYASGMGQKGDEADKTYTLKKYFEDGYLSMHDDVIDICGGKVTVEIVITNPAGKTTTITTLDQFKKFKFEGDPAGKEARTYTISYTFTDARFNSKTCEHTVTVVRNAPPIPNCSTEPVTMYKDKDCKALFSMSLDEIPTASVKYYHAARYGNCEGVAGPGGDCSKMKPATKKGGIGPEANKEKKFEEFTTLSGSRSGFKEISVYPDSVRLYDAAGNVITVNNPLDPKTDRVVTKDVTFRTWTGGGQCNCAEDVPYSYATANLSNFRVLPEILDEYDLPIGTNKYVWYYSNTYEKTDPASKVLVDSCVVTIEVKDTISPTLDCSIFNDPSKYYADESCELSQTDVEVKDLTVSAFKVKDNCTKLDSDFTLTVVRTFNSKKTSSVVPPYDILKTPYKVGVTTLEWIVTDESGNSASCLQTIEVLDTIGPKVDCDVVTPPLTAYVDATCKADADVVKEVGLQIPEIDDDPCSPTGGKISGVGVRDDGKDVMNDPYEKGITVITWTFTDASGASSVCKQKITVLDSIKPVFDCREILDTTVALAPDQCELSLEQVLEVLGEHTANDNCDGPIKGVPMLDVEGIKEIALKDPFTALRKDTTYHFVWHFVDKAGNDKTCDQYLTVADTTRPNASEACKNLTDKDVIAVDCKLPFSGMEVDLNSSIIDKCDGEIKAKVQAFIKQYDGTEERYDDEEILTAEFPVGTHKFLYIYTDHAGLSDTCVMYRTVVDKSKPIILDCYDGKDTVMGNVSSDVCGLTYEDLKDLIIMPKSYDECDMLANGGSIEFIDPAVKRYFWNIDTKKYDLVVDGDNEAWKVDPFPVGLTKLVFTFEDKSGNADSCVKYVNVVDARGPSFDCSKIDPNPYYPIADPGECSVVIGEIWDILNGDYWATRSCTDEKIQGVLTLYGTDKRVPADYVLEVGRDYHLTWVFRSEIDGKVATCDQIIRPNHQNPLDPNCDNAANIDTIKATADRCDVPGDSVITKFPYGIDFCTKDTIWGVPHRSDSLEISDPFPTGHTHITWTMVSPYNVEDTAKCEQDINIKGNKHFDLNCDELTPAMHRVVDSCGPIVMKDTLTIPQAEDPCANPDSSYYMRPGVGTRSDNPSLDPITDTYPLGQTWIEWVFTDFTGTISDTCNQLVDIRTSQLLQVNCDSIHADSIKIDVKEGECTIPASQVMDSLIARGYPFAKHPCLPDTFVGTPTRPNGLTMSDPFYKGPNEIIWVFRDDKTHTLVDSTITCSQIVIVGDINVPPVDCSQMPDTTIILDQFDCDIEFTEMKFNIKPVYDLCSGELVDSVVSRPKWGLKFDKKNGPYDDVLGRPFEVGVDTVYWKYDFKGYSFLCTQVITVLDSTEPIVDCDTINDETIVLPEGVCKITKEHVLDSLKQPYAYEYCSRIEIKGIPQLGTVTSSGDTTYSELPSEFKVGEPYIISWLFKNDTLSVVSKRCDIVLTIMSSSKPVFDCEQFKDTVKKYATGSCDVVLDETILPIPEAEDYCVPGYVVYGKGYKVDTVAGNPTYTLLVEMEGTTPSYKVGKLDVGVYHIAWVFDSKYSTVNDTCVETLNILTDKKMEIACVDLQTFAPTSEDSCSISVTLVPPLAKNPCTNEVILPDTVIRSDKIPFKGVDDTFFVGQTTVYWIYVDHSNTLKDSIDTCAQLIQVGDIKDPVIKCPKDTLVTLPLGVCTMDPAVVNLSATEPSFRDFCADTIVPLLKVWRSSGKLITEPFDLGIDTVFRRYIYHGVEYICEQQIKVRNAGIDSFNCDMLGISNNDTITVELKTAGNSVPFSEVEKKGFKLPDFTLLNACGQLVITYTREFNKVVENKQINDPYLLGVTKITLVVKDTTPGSESQKTCVRYINVVNTGAPSMECPTLSSTNFICYKDIPDSYKTVEEFVAGNGKFVAMDGTDGIGLVDPTTFKVDSVIKDVNGDKVSTMALCEFTMTVTYRAKDLRGQDVTPCSHSFHVKDNVPPVWDASVASDSVQSICTFTVPIDNSVFKAKDECWDVVYDNPVPQTNGVTPKSGIFYTDWTNKSSDPSVCEYYSYDSVRTYIAYDACNNKSEPIVTKRQVRKTEKPQINIPQSFIDLVIPATPKRPCLYVVPDVDSLLPVDIAADYCGDKIAVENFKHTQKPPKGTIINTQAGFINVTIVIEDPCGNKDSLQKRVEVPTRESVIKVDLKDTIVCAESNTLLSNDKLMNFQGKTWLQNIFTGTWQFVSTNAIWFDYYKGEISENGVWYSSNPNTYKWKFDQIVGKEAYLKLDSYSKTDTFYVVAMDTVSFCSDTAKAFIEIHESPTVTLSPELYTICEDDSLHLVSEEESLYDRFNVYTFENGESITEEGWMIDSDIYEPNSKIDYSDVPRDLKYYAKNGCGTSISKSVVSLNTKAKMRPDHLMLVTKPQNKPRVFIHESAELTLVSNYDPYEYHWYKVAGPFDGRFTEAFDKYGEVKKEYKDLIAEPDTLMEIKHRKEIDANKFELVGLVDTASYYVLMLDSVCPAVPSNVVSINVIKDIPTAFTPQNSIGANDVFMEGYPVIIFNRYGLKMVQSDNGWDGKCRGEFVDPGVYYYEIILKDNTKHKGTIEVVYFK